MRAHDRIRQAAGFLRTTNPRLTNAQIAGIVGNLVQESGLNPGAVGDTDMATPSTGIAQWRESRLDNRLAYEAERQEDQADSMLVQLGFLNEELTGRYKRDSGGLHGYFVNNPGMGPEDAAAIASKRFFRPHPDHANNEMRGLHARTVMDVMGWDEDGSGYNEDTVMLANMQEPPGVAEMASDMDMTADTPEEAIQTMGESGLDLDTLWQGVKRLMGEGGVSEPELDMPERTIGDNLIALGVGVSQLGSGQPVDISGVVARQNQRRLQEAQLQQHRAKAARAASAEQAGVSSEMRAAAGMAKVAVDAGILDERTAMAMATGEEGRKALAQITKDYGKHIITTGEPMNKNTLVALGGAARAAGLSDEVAQAISEEEGLAKAFVNQQLDANTPTAHIKTLQALNAPGNEKLKEAAERSDIIKAGGMNEFMTAVGKSYRTSMERDAEQIAQADGMLRMSQEATERLRALPNNTESSNITAAMADMQPMVDDIAAMVGIPAPKLVGEDIEQLRASMDAFIGQAFQTLRQPGSGHTSNMESIQFIKALPDMGSNIRTMRLRMAVLRKQAQIAIAGARYRDEYRANLIKGGQPGLDYSKGDMDAYSRNKLQENGEDEIFKKFEMGSLPRVPAGSTRAQAKAAVHQHMLDAGVGPDDPIMIKTKDGPKYYTLADLDPSNEVAE